ncbi:MAG: HAD-IA family hydrolase [Phycisphaerales bacterium]|nr:HAD-IA family hydrolase [Phycisphaerales bacterium]MCB9835973.1 HAD-IA family hydrolase [Phycisphaera sp.]
MLDCQLIIFDCDGVLVDTEPVTNRLLAECLTEIGWPMTTQQSIETFKGRDLHVIRAEAEAKVGRELPDLLPTYRSRMFEAFASEPIGLIEGALELLDALDEAGTHKRCVASNGPMNKMQASLTSAGLIDRFHHEGEARIYSAYDIGIWKPEPGLFLHAAERMGSRPSDAVVIEDSVSGIVAANRAGMRVVGLAGLTSAAALEEAGATWVITSLNEVLVGLGG